MTLAVPLGRQTLLHVRRQTTFIAVATGNFRSLRYYSEALAESQTLDDDPVIGVPLNNSRDATQPAPSLRSAKGDIKVPVDIGEFGFWLTMLLGDPTSSGEADPYTHTWISGAAVLPDFSLANQMGAGRFKRAIGLVGSALDLSFKKDNGFQSATVSCMAREVTKQATMTLGTEPAPLDYEPAPMQRVLLKVDGAAAGYVLAGELKYDNGITAENYLDGSDLTSAMIAGDATGSGSITVRLVDDVLLDIMNDPDTPHAIDFVMTTGIANRSLTMSLPKARFERTLPPIDGPGGIQFQGNFHAEQDADNPMLTAVLVNGITAATYTGF